MKLKALKHILEVLGILKKVHTIFLKKFSFRINVT